MCGIVGFNWNDRKLCKVLTDSIKHRGPDGEGLYFDNNVSLGHRRLSIIDLSNNGKQPMCNEDETVWVTYNGEIFNYEVLKKELISKGHKFYSKTDTEILVHGYEEWGIDLLQKLNGQFAFCIYDKKDKKLILARDRTGINPIYYYNKDGKFIFGSELKVLMNAGIDKEIDSLSLDYFFMYGYTPNTKSILKDCNKLEAGNYLIYNLKTSKISEIKKYWSISFSDEIKSEAEAIKQIQEKLDESIKKRMIGDVPVGAFLSGGVDSSAVVAIMSKYTENLNTFSVKFDHNDFDESEFAEIVSKRYNTKHHVIEFTSKDVRDLILKLPNYYDEPFGDSSMIPTFLVSKVARQHVTVSLSGDGGDELFGGYGIYKMNRLLFIQNYYPIFINRFFYKILNLLKFKILSKPLHFFRYGCYDKKLRYSRLSSYLDEDSLNILIKKPLDVLKEHSKYNKRRFTFLKEAINLDIHNYLCDDILTKVDRASLGNSLESRPPFLDNDVIDLALKINDSLKLKGNEGKFILKKALENLLSDKILYRKKQGFGVPLKYYFENELKDLVDKYVFNYKKHNLINQEIILKLKSESSSRISHRYSRILWSIMMFNLWYDRWMT